MPSWAPQHHIAPGGDFAQDQAPVLGDVINGVPSVGPTDAGTGNGGKGGKSGRSNRGGKGGKGKGKGQNPANAADGGAPSADGTPADDPNALQATTPLQKAKALAKSVLLD